LLAGVLTGFLPCGLVYGFLALASSSASVWVGLLIMSLFGAGTAPLMILAGAGGSLLALAGRRNLLRVSAVCVCVAGLVSIARGLLFLQNWGVPETARCVLCGPLAG
jgi:sulfite exporter TauE/SafE